MSSPIATRSSVEPTRSVTKIVTVPGFPTARSVRSAPQVNRQDLDLGVGSAEPLDESRLELGGQRGRQRITRFVSLTTDLRSSC